MKAGNIFLTISIPAIILLAWFLNEKEPENEVLQEKIFMQRADQIKRKGYEIDYRANEICGYYNWKDRDFVWHTDLYCVGEYGTVKVLPDSLTFFHRRMIEEVDKIADRKGYGGW